MKKAENIRLFPVGRILRSQGTEGELKIRLLSDVSVAKGRTVFLRCGQSFGSAVVEDIRRRQGSCYLRLGGIGTAEAAEAWKGGEILLPAADLESPGEGWFFAGQLLGCRVVTLSGREVGLVRQVIPVGESALLVVAREGREILVPLAADICREIRPEEGRIAIDPPDGLLDLNEI